MPATESYSGIELTTVSIIYCYVINYYKLNGLESFVITTLGPVDRLGSAGLFSCCLFCSCCQWWQGWSYLKGHLGWPF